MLIQSAESISPTPANFQHLHIGLYFHCASQSASCGNTHIYQLNCLEAMVVELLTGSKQEKARTRAELLRFIERGIREERKARSGFPSLFPLI